MTRYRIFRITAAAALAAAVFFLAACGGRPSYRGLSGEQDDEWIKMISEYRKSARENPDDQEQKSSLRRAELDAAEYFYRKAMEFKKDGKIDEAIASLQKGLASMPGNEKITFALAECVAVRESEIAYKDAMSMKEAGNMDEAQKLLEKSLEMQPAGVNAAKELENLANERKKLSESMAGSQKKTTLKFSNADIKTVLDFIGSVYGVSFIYDEGVKSLPLSVSADDVTFDQAMDNISQSGGVFFKKIGDKSMLVAQDTKAKRDQYEDLIIRTYQLNYIKASDMSSILKNALNLKRVTSNEALNTLAIRDSLDTLKLADKIVSLNDMKPAEVIFDVEIMEVNRTKSEQLGLNYGSQLTLTLPGSQTLGSLINGNFMEILKQGTVTLPAFTLNFFKQDVDAKMLANPRVRVLEGKQAKIHIGDRVPLRSSIIQDATGQVRYTYDYKDIGVMLDVTPKINRDNSVSVNLKLEVSSLGSNIGTATDPAYSIGTRDAETTMLLRDGETAILGGLIRDEERHNKIKIPGLGDIPLIGGLFTTSTDDTDERTDVLLTITPRVVRSWEYISKGLHDIYSGTENNMSSEPKYKANMDNSRTKGPKGAKQAEQAKPDSFGSTISAVVIDAASNTQSATAAASAPVNPGQVILSFTEDQYILQAGQDGTIKIAAENIDGITEMAVKIAFNSDYAKFVQADRSSYGIVTNMTINDNKAGAGTVEFDLKLDTDKKATGKTALVEMKFTGIKPGVSYLVFLDNKVKNREGSDVNVQRTASRLVIK
jgi:general secretion pathway protein D